jgi:predicted deacylase
MRRVVVSALANGTEIALYLHEFVGTAGDGPTVGICAAIHGNEPTGTEIALEVARRFADRQFRGRLVLLPVANPLAFEANRRNTPLDDLNLNRLFPGNPDGWFSEQLAHVITEEFLSKIDALIDIHSGGDRPTVDYVYIRNAEDLSRSFGSPVLYRARAGKVGTTFDGTSVTVTEGRGIPSVTVELGGGLIAQTPYVQRGVKGIENMLRVMQVIDETPVPPPDQIVVNGIETIRPHRGGFLETEAPALGEAIQQNAVLGRIVSPHTFEVLEEIRNPVPNGIMILSHLTRNLVQPGDYGYMVGSPE